MDVASEMIHSLLPVFLVSVLGASTTIVGLIEGIGEATASVTKLFSGWLSDRRQQRKNLTLLGYGLGALSKPFFALAPTTGWVLAARFSDRVGKGIRGAPRDALVGDLTPPNLRGAAYGLRQSLDTVGAFMGPLLAMALMRVFDDDFRAVFRCAILPALASVAVLAFAVHEPHTSTHREAATRPPLRWSELAHLGAQLWGVIGVAAILTLARFSEAFLILRAQAAGLPLAGIPVVLILMNVVYAASAYPMGILSDRIDRRMVLAVGFAVLVVADVVLAFAPSLGMVLFGVALWGLHMGMTQGLLAALVADHAPADLRGSAFGVLHLTTGIAVLLASLLAGILWDWRGPQTTFLAGAILTAVGILGALALHRRQGK